MIIQPVVVARWGRWGSLGVPNFRTYFLGTAVSQSSAWLLRITQSWLVLDLTGSPAALGVLALAQFLPVTILTLFAGVLIDRVGTRWLLVLTQAVMAVQATILAALVLTSSIQYWQILVLATVLGTAQAFDTPARSALVSQLVGPGHVGNAIALNSALGNGSRIVGPGIGGVMITLWGNGAGFGLAAVGCTAALAGVLLLKPEQFYPKRQAGHGAVMGQMWDGVVYAMGNPRIAFNIVLMAFVGTFAYNWGVTLPILARYALDGGPEGFGALNVAMGLGSVLGGVLLATRVVPSERLVLISAAVYSVLVTLLALSPSMNVALGQLVLVGALSIVYTASSNTLLQIEAREEFRGRVLALFMLLWSGTTPIGSAFTGFASDRWGIRVALGIDGTLCIAGVLVAIGYLVLSRGGFRLPVPGTDAAQARATPPARRR